MSKSRPTLGDHWRMITRNGVEPLDFDDAVEAMGRLVSISPAPYRDDNGQTIEDAAGNYVDAKMVVDVLNHVPALLVALKLALQDLDKTKAQIADLTFELMEAVK